MNLLQSRSMPAYTFSLVAKKYILPEKMGELSPCCCCCANAFLMEIPRGRKLFAWFTFQNTKNVIVFVDAATNTFFASQTCEYSQLNWGTIVYGTLMTRFTFVTENIFFLCGKKMEHNIDNDGCVYKLNSLLQFFKLLSPSHLVSCSSSTCDRGNNITIRFQMANIDRAANFQARPVGGQNVYRYYILSEMDAFATKLSAKQNNDMNLWNGRGGKIRKKMFVVSATPTCDIYYLHHQGPQTGEKQDQMAFIPDYRTSVYMNSLFRDIKENRNIDAAEESDDETDFEDVRVDKYVKLNLHLNIMCYFNYKFKYWVPIVPEEFAISRGGRSCHGGTAKYSSSVNSSASPLI